MSLLLRSTRALQKAASVNPAASFASHAAVKDEWNPVGNREVVGQGSNGQINYIDREDYPFPAVRFRPPTPDVLALREKEKGDWKKLSIAEKKALYRASFCQTYAEMTAPTGEWKSIVGCALGLVSAAVMAFIAMKHFIYPQELPETFQLERQQAQLQKMIDMQFNPIEGIASQWDYEKNDWKK